MGLELIYGSGQTPIDEDEKADLKITAIATRKQLDEFEQANIAEALNWTLKKKYTKQEILSINFLKKVHQKMFGEVWKWAGAFRKTNKNIGVDKTQIAIDLKNLVDDCLFWIDNQTFPDIEIAIRFKHRLVSIHPFPNGNGRHSRLIADIIISNIFDKAPFSWGGSSLTSDDEIRATYLVALREADRNQYENLLKFATF